MSRRNKPEKRIPSPDTVYSSVRLAKFINRLMKHGKKGLAERIVYSALETVKKKTNMAPLEAFEKALNNVRPLVWVKSRRVGGSTYQVPMEVDEYLGEAIASRWVISFARSRSGRTMSDKLASEMMDAINGTGAAMRKRDETHRMAEANKAFAHYRY
jgi:small subunit ribosomal protein S7